MIFIAGYIIGSLITLALVLTVLYLYFHNQHPIETRISQIISQSRPKGDFIQAPTDTEIARKDKIDKLSKIKNEIRLSEILEDEII
jgi:hypothetical protein